MTSTPSVNRPSLFWGGPILAELVIALLPLIFFAIIFNQLPDRIAVHFDGDGIANRYAAKDSLDAFVLAGIGLTGFVTARLLRIICMLISRGKQAGNDAAASRMITCIELFIIITFSFIGLYGLNHARSASDVLDDGLLTRAIFVGVNLLFMFMGNICPKLRFNSCFGIKTPGSLASKPAWNKVQRTGGRILFWGGLFNIIVTCLPFISTEAVRNFHYVFIILLVIALLAYRPKDGSEAPHS